MLHFSHEVKLLHLKWSGITHNEYLNYHFNLLFLKPPVRLKIITLEKKTNDMIIWHLRALYMSMNKNEIIDNVSWGNLGSREWKENTIHIVFISNFTDIIDDMVIASSPKTKQLRWDRELRNNFWHLTTCRLCGSWQN